MSNTYIGIYQLPYNDLYDINKLIDIYTNTQANYYWSDDFSASYYIAQAKAGFIAVSDTITNQEVLLPEIQYAYALLDFKDIYIPSRVTKLIKSKKLTITIDDNFEEIQEYLDTYHKNNWLNQKYASILRQTQELKNTNFRAVTVYIEYQGEIVAGEIGYIIGATYTSLSGFSSKKYKSFGTAQMVLLAQKLQNSGFDFWNLGHPYMDYKQKLGAKIYQRDKFLIRWYKSTQKELKGL